MSRILEAINQTPICVWNQAYQENHDADTYQEIVQNARGCYTLIDPFDGELGIDTAEKIKTLHDNDNVVGCYMSLGTCEDWRPDFWAIRDYCVDKKWNDWHGEYFVYDIDRIYPHMLARIDKMAEWGCDYVEFDNMDWCTWPEYREDYGSSPGKEFPSPHDCAEHNKEVCEYAREKGIRCMAKNTGYNVNKSYYSAGDFMDAVTYESYRENVDWWDRYQLQDFLDNDKPVIIVHYDADSDNDPTNVNSCVHVLNTYRQAIYQSNKISFICESRSEKKYIHFNTDGPPAPTSSPITPLGSDLEVYPFRLTTQVGIQTNDWHISALRDLNNDWDSFIKLGKWTKDVNNRYRGIFQFKSNEADLSSFGGGAKLTVHFFGNGGDDKRWQFQIKMYDYSSQQWEWITLGDNSSFDDWEWSLADFQIPNSAIEENGLNALQYDNNPIVVRLWTVLPNNEWCAIDYMKLTFLR